MSVREAFLSRYEKNREYFQSAHVQAGQMLGGPRVMHGPRALAIVGDAVTCFVARDLKAASEWLDAAEGVLQRCEAAVEATESFDRDRLDRVEIRVAAAAAKVLRGHSPEFLLEMPYEVFPRYLLGVEETDDTRAVLMLWTLAALFDANDREHEDASERVKRELARDRHPDALFMKRSSCVLTGTCDQQFWAAFQAVIETWTDRSKLLGKPALAYRAPMTLLLALLVSKQFRQKRDSRELFIDVLTQDRSVAAMAEG